MDPSLSARQPPPTRLLRPSTTLVPTLAVLAVVVAALGAALEVTRAELHGATPSAPVPVASRPAACLHCGFVESVVAVRRQAPSEGIAVAYRVRVRLNDGTVRTVEQRTSLAAGARVIVEDGVARPRPAQG